MATIDAIQMQINSLEVRSAATALPAHDRKYGFIQNVSTSNRLYVKLGSDCSTTDYDFFLDPGDSTTIEENGIITVAGTSKQYTAFER
jgi:hypothetical protein